MHEHLEELTAQDQLKCMGSKVFSKYKPAFKPIPHVNNLPTDMYCQIQLKDATRLIATQSYSSPQKYCEAWWTLLQHHKDTGQIHPSNSSSASPSFLVPKSDTTVLPHWVNDYCVLNSNMVLDLYPLPCVDDILTDCTKGHIWSCLNMMNSFFQTQVHPDDVHLTVVTTPFGLYELTAMPQGLKNVPPIHQHWMNTTLCPFIGKICHIYICNPKKCAFFLTEMDFLGHHIHSWDQTEHIKNPENFGLASTHQLN